MIILPNVPECVAFFRGYGIEDYVMTGNIEDTHNYIEITKLYGNSRNIHNVNYTNNILRKFKYVYYLLKCKKRLRRWLWLNVREKFLRKQLAPKRIKRLLRNGVSLDELENKI
jgi:hypothetical protein